MGFRKGGFFGKGKGTRKKGKQTHPRLCWTELDGGERNAINQVWVAPSVRKFGTDVGTWSWNTSVQLASGNTTKVARPLSERDNQACHRGFSPHTRTVWKVREETNKKIVFASEIGMIPFARFDWIAHWKLVKNNPGKPAESQDRGNPGFLFRVVLVLPWLFGIWEANPVERAKCFCLKIEGNSFRVFHLARGKSPAKL